MFKYGTFHLTESICDCAGNKLKWGIDPEVNLHISCGQCKTQLFVPKSKFVMGFELERCNTVIKKDEPKKEIEGNIIPFRKSEE